MATDQSKFIWYNGKVIEWEKATIHTMSHVLHYGSGIFEGIKCYNTKSGPAIFRLEEHIKRLFQSADQYKMSIPYSKEDIINGCKDIIIKNDYKECYLRPLVFYGYDTLGVHPKDCPVMVTIACFYWGAYLGDDGVVHGVRLTISPWEKFSSKAMPATAKASGQYLNSMLSVTDARERGFDEALLLNCKGNIAEGSGQNIFFIKDNQLFTNDQTSDILMGVTRATIIKIAQDIGYKVNIQDITLDDLLNADEAFLSGTATEVTPIQSIDDVLISDGNPGNITQKIKLLYQEIIHGNNKQYSDWLTYI